jgi:hypothetical protein
MLQIEAIYLTTCRSTLQLVEQRRGRESIDYLLHSKCSPVDILLLAIVASDLSLIWRTARCLLLTYAAILWCVPFGS